MTAHTDDDALLAELRAIAGRADPIPELVDQAARDAFSWRDVDAQLAALTYDSAAAARPLAGVRGSTDTRALSFALDEIAIELEIEEHGDVRRILGQLAPAGAAEVELRHPSGTRQAEVDDLGRFRLDGVPVGPCSLRVALPDGRVVQTDWTLL